MELLSLFSLLSDRPAKPIIRVPASLVLELGWLYKHQEQALLAQAVLRGPEIPLWRAWHPNQTRHLAEGQDAAFCKKSQMQAWRINMPGWGPQSYQLGRLYLRTPGPPNDFLPFLIWNRIEEFMWTFFRKFRQSQTSLLQVILGLHFIGRCFGKNHFSLCVPGSTQQNWAFETPELWVQALDLDNLGLNPSSTVCSWASCLSFLCLSVLSSVKWE